MSRGAWTICTVWEWSTGILKGYALSLKVGTLTFSTEFICQLNILVDQACHARLADFGFLTTISDSTTLSSSTSNDGGTLRWMSPELLQKEARRTKLSDCYALGMVVYEVLSGHMPFHDCVRWHIADKVIRGDRPERPQGVEGTWFADGVWEVLAQCWVAQPEDRPSAKEVLQFLEKVSGSWIPPPPLADQPAPNTSEIARTQTTDVSDVGEIGS